MIEIQGLTRRFGERTVLQDVSFQVGEGEVVGFLGPNGAGKTTTLRILTGFLAPTAGTVRVGGIDVQRDPLAARRLLGYLPEGVPIYPEMRVHEYLRFRAELKGVPRRRIGAALDRALEQAGVRDAADRIVGQLSKGYRQRVGLADALVADPPLLVLDEPTSGLDPNQIRQVRSLVRSLAGQKTILLSTHILPEVEASCERVVILHRGRVAGQGAPGELRARAASAQLVTAVVRGERDRARALLEGVEGVRSVRAVEPVGEGDVFRVRLEADPAEAVLEEVAAALHEAGLRLRELRSEAASLEEVFAALTTEEPSLGPRPAEPPEAGAERRGEGDGAGEDEDSGRSQEAER